MSSRVYLICKTDRKVVTFLLTNHIRVSMVSNVNIENYVLSKLLMAFCFYGTLPGSEGNYFTMENHVLSKLLMHYFLWDIAGITGKLLLYVLSRIT